VVVAYDGPTAIEAAHRFRPEIVLLDIGMPGMDGYDVARALRSASDLGPIRLVALTGWGQKSDHERSLKAGFDLHLVKPVDPDQLMDLLTSEWAGA
jgi:CheY-like chemotaxis protein